MNVLLTCIDPKIGRMEPIWIDCLRMLALPPLLPQQTPLWQPFFTDRASARSVTTFMIQHIVPRFGNVV